MHYWGIFLYYASILGYINFAHDKIKIPLNLSPLAVISFLGISQFAFALNNCLEVGTIISITTGIILFGYYLTNALVNKNKFFESKIILIFLVASIIGFFYAKGMHYRVSDEFVYWGIISKAIYLKGGFVESNTSIVAHHLKYPPGLAVWHYFCFKLLGGYSQTNAYFAQGQVFISFLLIFVNNKQPKISPILLVFLAFSYFFGSILAKLQVDYLVAALFLSLLWVSYTKKSLYSKGIFIALISSFIVITKEIGLFFAVGFLLTYLIVNWKPPQSKQTIVIAFLGSISLILYLSISWKLYTQNHGFINFVQKDTKDLLGAFNFFASQNPIIAIKIFIKDFFIKAPGQFKIPYIFWYCLMGYTAYRLNANSKVSESYKRYFPPILIIGAIYLIMLYILDFNAFGMGRERQESLSFPRYFNIYFVPILCFIFFKNLKFPNFNKFASLSLIFVVTTLILVTKIHYMKDKFKHIETASKEINHKLNLTDNNNKTTICIKDKSEYWYIFIYHLYPKKVIAFDANKDCEIIY